MPVPPNNLVTIPDNGIFDEVVQQPIEEPIIEGDLL